MDAMKQAAEEETHPATFHGYGPEQGYDFLRMELQKYYASFGVKLAETEIFVSDGAKSDLGNFLDLLDRENTVLVPDPVYPVYRDTNVMDGRRILYMRADRNNAFLPMPDPEQKVDVIYLCSPNNPTGAAYTRDQLAEWVAFANQQQAVILFDAAYESFIQDADVPHSIFEIPGARTCAVDFAPCPRQPDSPGFAAGIPW